ncbi:MAG: MFS transporter [Betaproteobacteria bacterium]|nr:MFS transporter [Betaproteobacteria bacterium]
MADAAAARWSAVWAIFAGGLVAGAYIGKVPAALPTLRSEFDLSLVESGFIATMFNVIGGLGGMLAGVLCDRYGQKRLGLAGLAVMSAGGMLGAGARSYEILLGARFVEGAGFILFSVSGAALMSAAARAPRDRAKALALWSAYMPAGGSLALLLAPLAIAAWGWRGLWAALALAAALAFVLVARFAPAPRFGSVRSLKLALESIAQKGSLALAALFAFYVAQWTSVMIWLPTFLVDQRGASNAVAATLTALMVLVNVPGNLGGGWLIGRGARRGPLVIAACAIMALCSAGMLGAWLPDAARFLLVLVFSMSAGVIPAAIFSGVPVHARTPQHIGTTNGMVMQTSQAGQFIGPIVLAWLAAHFGGWGATLWAMLAFAAGGAGCGFALALIERRRAARD